MEMESSRRPPFDGRSREIGIKRQRLAEESPNIGSRPFQQQRLVNSSPAASSRLRSNDRDRDRDSDDSFRGSYQQQSPHQDHELLTRYKDALSDLTFNSKPMITNLTIIAGEASPAAKAEIASLICGNIIEVPSDQKLPSLYLLDSIVKNIGKEYIKHFAPRLPEVFIKAYRQVDRPVHQSMRHLFGTWKGVFPLQPLQLIEKELGMSPANGSSSGSTINRAESQSQRQPHGIHVNPKYLEARQRLQLSSRPKMLPDDVGGAFVDATEDMERPGRKGTSGGAVGLWGDTSSKMQNIQRPQREDPRDSLLEKVPKEESEDYEYSSGISKQLSSRLGKVNERIKDPVFDRQWLSSDTELEEPITSLRNGYDSKSSVGNFPASRLGNFNVSSKQKVPSGSSGDLSRSWKNSEEEEFSWDELNPRLASPALVIEDLDNLEYGKQSQSEVGPVNEREPMNDRYLVDQREQLSFGQRRSSPWPLQDQLRAHNSTVSLSKSGFQSHMDSAPPIRMAVSGSSGPIGQHHPSSRKPLIPQQSSTSSFSTRDPRLLFSEKDHTQSNLVPTNRKATSFIGQLDLRPHDESFRDPVPALDSRLPLDKLKKMEPQASRKPTPATSLKSKRPARKSPQLPSSHLDSESQVPPDASSLLASVMKSGILSSLGPALSTGPLSTLPDDFKPSSSSTLSGDAPSSLPSSAGNQGATTTSSSSDPFSSLLSTLVAKGLISTSNSESALAIPPESSKKSQAASPSVAATVGKVEAPKVSKSSAIPSPAASGLSAKPAVQMPKQAAGVLSAKPAVQMPKPAAGVLSAKPAVQMPRPAAGVASAKPAVQIPKTKPQLKTKEIQNLIGFEFRSDILREFHPHVVNELFDELPHSCSICGLRLKLKERFERHMEWHALKESEEEHFQSRRWYSSAKDWIAGKPGIPTCCSVAAPLLVSSDNTSVEQLGPMVPADETQCVCLLCGELFEDCYSQEEDKWMFKGAVFMEVPFESCGKELSAGQASEKNLIVHGKCLSDDSANDLRLATCVKLENDV